MDCNFYINNDRIYHPRDARVTGTLTLTASSEIRNVSHITYGIKSKVQILPHYDSHGNITNPIVYDYYFQNNNMRLLGSHRSKTENSNTREVFVLNNVIMDENTKNDKVVSMPDGTKAVPKGATIVTNFELDFPQPDEWYLPSSCHYYLDHQYAYSYTFTVQYFVYVKVDRLSTILKREKFDQFLKEISYQAGTEFPFQAGLLPYSERKVFKSKMPKENLPTDSAGRYDSTVIASTSRKPKFVRRFLNRKEGSDVPFSLDFKVQSLVSIYKPLPEQFTLTFAFDFAHAKFPLDFGSDKVSTGLGLFQVESLKIKVKYIAALDNNGDMIKMDQKPQKILAFQFKDLVFDMKNVIYSKETNTGTLVIPPEMLMSQQDLHLPLQQLLKQPVLTSSDVFDGLLNFTTLDFVWTIMDTDNKFKVTFNTDATFSAELDSCSAPPYMDPSPAYKDIKDDTIVPIEDSL